MPILKQGLSEMEEPKRNLIPRLNPPSGTNAQFDEEDKQEP